jgi:hybrid polyketide synthase/nonribosomal peptide synthetase FtdB
VENVPNLLDHYLRLLRALRLDNYILLGFSAGGRVAIKLAELLSEQGMNVSTVILLDSPRESLDAQQFETEHEIYFEQELHAFAALGNRQEIMRRMREYGKFALTTLQLQPISANIHYIQAVGSDKIAWQDATSGKCVEYQGVGEHVAMLNPPAVSENAQLVQQILDTLPTSKS